MLRSWWCASPWTHSGVVSQTSTLISRAIGTPVPTSISVWFSNSTSISIWLTTFKISSLSMSSSVTLIFPISFSLSFSSIPLAWWCPRSTEHQTFSCADTCISGCCSLRNLAHAILNKLIAWMRNCLRDNTDVLEQSVIGWSPETDSWVTDWLKASFLCCPNETNNYSDDRRNFDSRCAISQVENPSRDSIVSKTELNRI